MSKFVWIALVSALAQPAFAAKEAPTHFKCGSDGHGTAFSVQFDGGRFSDAIDLQYLEADLKQLLMASEQSLPTSQEYMTANLQVGACKKPASGDVLVECRPKSSSWAMFAYGFTKVDDLGGGFSQTVKIERNARVRGFDLKVTKVGDDAFLKIDAVVDTSDRNGRVLRIERKLGTLKQDWYMCRFE